MFCGGGERLVLRAMAELEDNAYGMTIRQVIEGRTDWRLPFGQVYAGLERLEAKGHLVSRVAGPEPMRCGRSKKLYTPVDESVLPPGWTLRSGSSTEKGIEPQPPKG